MDDARPAAHSESETDGKVSGGWGQYGVAKEERHERVPSNTGSVKSDHCNTVHGGMCEVQRHAVWCSGTRCGAAACGVVR